MISIYILFNRKVHAIVICSLVVDAWTTQRDLADERALTTSGTCAHIPICPGEGKNFSSSIIDDKNLQRLHFDPSSNLTSQVNVETERLRIDLNDEDGSTWERERLPSNHDHWKEENCQTRAVVVPLFRFGNVLDIEFLQCNTSCHLIEHEKKRFCQVTYRRGKERRRRRHLGLYPCDMPIIRMSNLDGAAQEWRRLRKQLIN